MATVGFSSDWDGNFVCAFLPLILSTISRESLARHWSEWRAGDTHASACAAFGTMVEKFVARTGNQAYQAKGSTGVHGSKPQEPTSGSSNFEHDCRIMLSLRGADKKKTRLKKGCEF